MARHTPLQLLVLCAFVIVIGQSRAVAYIDSSDIPNKNMDETAKEPFSLMDVYTNFFYMTGFNGTWISDFEIMITDMFFGDVKITDVKTGKSNSIFYGKDIPLLYKMSTVSATISPNRKYILLGCNTLFVYRHSTLKMYMVYDMQRKAFRTIANAAYLSLATWSPIGSNLVYVLDNDIYYMTLTRGGDVVRRLTYSGKPGKIYNGIPDWAYEEEVYASPTALWYSPDGQYLAFASFNDTQVKTMTWSDYGSPGSLKDQYPTQVEIKYPKAGTPNPVVSLSVIDLSDPSSKVVALKAPDVVTSDNVLYAVSWWNETHVVATWTNRVQNQSQLTMYDMQGDAKLVLYDEETEGWLQPNSPIKAGDYALLLRREDSGTGDGRFRHIVKYLNEDDQFIKPVDLTPGPSEVQTILAVDSSSGVVYYLATAPNEPSQRNLYSVPLDGSQKPTCISCELLTPEGNKCTYATASFSTQRSYYAVTCSGPDPTTVEIYNKNHQSVSTWNTNMRVRELLSERLVPQQRNYTITVNGYDCRVKLLLPPDFDENKVYPMLVYVYGGPNTLRIIEEASFGYEHYFTTNRNVIYALIDGRGSSNKGSKMLFEIYRKMGTVEIEDTIAVTAILQKRYKWIDANRTGIWGWSYGGFHTGMALAKDDGSVFKCGISVAPVTSWIYYDSVYTERFMGLPTAEDNLIGYNNTDISRISEGIRGKKYMVIHGTGDDNVHYQQAMSLIKSLEYQDIMFEQVTYTDEAHSLTRVLPHLYHTMDKFWGKCFGWAR
ncbi:PREDICTED: venom dipeptidyl peptidase 4-like [Vollenhovia emeryi]|uniref:venom dipeptidyl peptidase 4-like n=1 Tax=Vollenhovia emeryi TaxID=411798 RepID=UPI0005F48226|nr:PREDICTED: venom dipeptidyl peptidase 4-like [Vollenhovia emeryi]